MARKHRATSTPRRDKSKVAPSGERSTISTRPAGIADGPASLGDDHLQTRDDVIGDLAARAQAHVAGQDRQV
jgi:hypothetical protein